MATIRKQKVGKYTYWQIVESKRVNGKPRPVVLMHLGTAEQLLYKLKGGPLQKKIKSYSHGAVYALWKIAEEMNLPSIFTQYFSSQKREDLLAGESLLLASIHRAIKPGSKRAFAEFARQTTLHKIAGFDPDRLDSQHFWDQMNTVTDAQLEKVEKEITLKMIEKGLFSTRLLFYDLTNFFTYIATENKRTSLAQRGKNKQKRSDLRQFGLAQVVTKEFLIPVFSEVYEGNEADKKLFIPYLTRLREKLAELNFNIEEFTIVFDKGSNSVKNFASLEQFKLPYVASLTPVYHEDLLSIPLWRYWGLKVNGKRILCYRTKKQIWGKERIVVLYTSEKLREGQIRGLHQALASKYQKLQDLREALQSPKARRRKKEDLERQIQTILKDERTDFLIDVYIQEKGDGHFDIEWEIDSLAYKWVTETLFGKRVLVTCHEEWPEEEIIAAYWGQSNVERVFKHFKNPYHHAVRPQYHWTDQKIKAHTFICLIGLLLSQILYKKACNLGYSFSIENLLDRLMEVRETEIVTITDLKGRPHKEVQLEYMEPALQKIYEDLIQKPL
jgi:transposase